MPKLNDVLRRIADYAKKIEVESNVDEGVKFAEIMISRGNATLFLRPEDAQGYRELVEETYEVVQEQGSGISKRSIENLITDFLFSVLETETRKDQNSRSALIRKAIGELRQKLQATPERWVMQVSVGGLDVSGLPAKVGETEFHVFDEAREQDLTAKIVQSVIEKGGTREQGEQFVQGSVARLRNTTVATLPVLAADFDGAYEAALMKIRITIDAINFYNSRSARGGWLYIPGEAYPAVDVVLAVGNAPRVGYRRHGPGRPIRIREITQQPGFQRISDLLAKMQLSDFDERVLAALQWAGRAQVDPRREEAFLLFAISLESLMLAKETTTELSHRLGVRCAHLGGGTVEERKLVVRQIKDLYGIRSRIVHSGSFQVPNADFELMREYAMLSLFLVLDTKPFKSMSTVREFEDWFDTRLLSYRADTN